MLDIDSAIPFLVERGLVDQEAVVAGDVAVEAITRRNRNLRVLTSHRSGLFIKQPDDLVAGGDRTFRAECDFYRKYSSNGSAVGELLPQLLLCEPVGPLLVLELLPDHQTLTEFHHSFHGFRFPIHAWTELGRRLGKVHATLRRGAPAVSRAPAWVTSLANVHQPNPDALSALSPARLKLLEILQASNVIPDGLGCVVRDWCADTVVHGDLRADNVLVRANAGQVEDMRLIDWELHHVGDPLWDVAGCLDFLVAYWLSCLPPSQAEDTDETADASDLSWTIFQAGSRAFWRGYLATAERDDVWAAGAAPKAARFAAARMAQSALEMTTHGALLPPSAVLLLQVCENVFADPAGASTELFSLT